MRPQSQSDQSVLELLRQFGTLGIPELISHLGVTATAVRQRLDRLINGGLVDRIETRQGRGRPSYRYQLNERGLLALGHNMSDLAKVLWNEIQRISDTEVRRELLARVSARMAQMYGGAAGLPGDTPAERLETVAGVLRDNQYRVTVEPGSGVLPILRINGCPYPELSGKDHEICKIEAAMLDEMLGEKVRLTNCRCDTADGSCTFEFAQALESA